MGFLDKAKQLAQQAETQLNQATSQVGGAQNAKVADAWLKELGQWVYADRMGRDPRAAAEVEVRIQQLQQDGLSVRKISAAVQVPVGTVHKYLAKGLTTSSLNAAS